MTDAASAPTRVAGRRIALGLSAVLAAAVSLGGPGRAASPQPIVIPPAKLPPVASPPPAATEAEPGVRPVARELLPGSVRVLRDPQSPGLVMYGALTGSTPSALGALLGVFAYSQAFDPSPVPRLVLADRDDRQAQALFTAAVRGAPVAGVAAVALDETGGDVAVFYDTTDAFPVSFPRLRAAFGQDAAVVASPVRLGDGSEIALPPGWLVVAQGKGSVEIAGPQGELVSLGAVFPVFSSDAADPGYGLRGACCDPEQALRTVFSQPSAIEQRAGLPPEQLTAIVARRPTVAGNGADGAFVLASLGIGGRAYSGLAEIYAGVGFTEPWTVHLSDVKAPQPLFADALPTLLQIWKSYSANPPDFAGRLQDAAENMDATRSLLPPPRHTRGFNASPAWDPAIASLAAGDGKPPTDPALGATLAERLSADTGRQWRVVPLSDLKSGGD